MVYEDIETSMNGMQAGNAIAIDTVTVIPVERSRVYRAGGCQGYWLYGCKEPVAVVISDERGLGAFDMHGRALPLEELLRAAAGLEAALAQCRPNSGR